MGNNLHDYFRKVFSGVLTDPMLIFLDVKDEDTGKYYEYIKAEDLNDLVFSSLIPFHDPKLRGEFTDEFNKIIGRSYTLSVQKNKDVVFLFTEKYSSLFSPSLFCFNYARMLERAHERYEQVYESFLKRAAEERGIKGDFKAYNDQIFLKDIYYANPKDGMENALRKIRKSLEKITDPFLPVVDYHKPSFEVYTPGGYVNNKGPVDLNDLSEKERTHVAIVSSPDFFDYWYNVSFLDMYEFIKYSNLKTPIVLDYYMHQIPDNTFVKTYSLRDEILSHDVCANADEFTRIAKKYAKFIDFEKLYLLCLERYERSIELLLDWPEDFKDKDFCKSAETVRSLQKASDFYHIDNEFERITNPEDLEEFVSKFEEMSKQFKGVLAKTKLEAREPGKYITYNSIMNKYNAFMKNCLGLKHYSPEEIAEMRNKILAGTLPISSYKPEELKRVFAFTPDEINSIASKSPEAFKYISDEDLITNPEIILDKYEEIPKEVLDKYFKKEDAYFDLLIKYFLAGKLRSQTLQNYKSDLENDQQAAILEKLGSLITIEQMLDYYKEAQKEDATLEEKLTWKRYAELFYYFKIQGKDDKTKSELEDKIIDGMIDKEIEWDRNDFIDLRNLYHERLFSLDKIIDLSSIDVLLEMMRNNECRPVELKSLFEKDIINYEFFENIIRSKNFNYQQKMEIIYSVFNDEGSRETATRLLSSLNNIRSADTQEEGSGHEPVPGPAPKWNTYYIDPYDRYSLIKAIDEDFQMDLLPACGYNIIYLPNIGKYVIEQLYERNKPSTGHATYFVDKDVYEEHKHEIVRGKKDNEVDERKIFIGQKSYLGLLPLTKKGLATKIYHGKDWAINFRHECGIDTDDRYSEEKKQHTYAIAKGIKKILLTKPTQDSPVPDEQGTPDDDSGR